MFYKLAIQYTDFFFQDKKRRKATSNKDLLDENIERVLNGKKHKGEVPFPKPSKNDIQRQFQGNTINDNTLHYFYNNVFFKIKIMKLKNNDRMIIVFSTYYKIVYPILCANKKTKLGFNLDKGKKEIIFENFFNVIDEVINEKSKFLKKQNKYISFINIYRDYIDFGSFNFNLV